MKKRTSGCVRWFSAVLALLFATLLAGGSALAQQPTAPSPGSPDPASPQEESAQLADPQELETFLDGIMSTQLETHNIPGATVAVVKDGQPFFAKGYGFADLERREPVVADGTLFRIGSVTKLFTATAVMQLAEDGRLDLDADVSTVRRETLHLSTTYGPESSSSAGPSGQSPKTSSMRWIEGNSTHKDHQFDHGSQDARR